MHLLRKYDVAPLRYAMMRCLPQNVAKPRIIRRSRHHWALPNIICQRQTSFKKRTFVGRQKCVFCWRRRRDLNRLHRPLASHSRLLSPALARLGILLALAPSLRKNDTLSFLLARPCRNRQGSNLDFGAKRKTTRLGGFSFWRRRRDLNSRAGLSRPTPLAGAPLRPT